MAKMTVTDDFGNVLEFDPDERLLLNDIKYWEEANAIVKQGLDGEPVGERRSGILSALIMDGARDWYLEIMWHCECGKSVLMSHVVVPDDDSDCMCPDCAKEA